MRKRNKIERIESEVKKLEKERHELYQAYGKLGYVDLPKPIRNGWSRSLVLREDIGRRKDARIIDKVLNVCKYNIWGRDTKHLSKNWKDYLIKRKTIVFPGVELVNSCTYKKMPPKIKNYFIPVKSKWSSRSGYEVSYQVILPSYYFVLKDSRSYLTKQKVTDRFIESRIQEIREVLRSQKYYRFSYGYSYNCSWRTRDKYHRFIESSDREMKAVIQRLNCQHINADS